MLNKKKKLIILLVLLLLLIAIFVFLIQSNTTVLETYTLTQQGLMKKDTTILDERFDQNGNLVYYKYKSPDNGDISEFNFTYKYDNYNRISEVNLNDADYVQIEYENDKISKINETVSNPLSDDKDIIQFVFKYLENDAIVADKIITTSNGDGDETSIRYTLNYQTVDYKGKKCIILTEKDSTGADTFETLYEKELKDVNYNNLYELLNIVPLGYSSTGTTFKDTKSSYNSLSFLYPALFSGNVIYIKSYIKTDVYSDATNTGANYQYDNVGRLLKYYTYNYETNQTINYMYESINSKEYYEYTLIKTYSSSKTEYKYIKNKVYLNDNKNIYKKETIQSDTIDEKDFISKLSKFEKYLETESTAE